MFKFFVRKTLEGYVKKYFKRHKDVKLVVVTGSVGKTSTKVAIATVLSEGLGVRMDRSNHNTLLSAPVAILGIKYPENIRNPLVWLDVFKAAKLRIKQPTDVDVIVQELGSDRVGEIKQFGKYLHPDISVVTAVSPEHMEFFKTIENVAQEELGVTNYSKQSLINEDDIDKRFADFMKTDNFNTYGLGETCEYRFAVENFSIEDGFRVTLSAPELADALPANVDILGEHMLRPAAAAAAVGVKMGLNENQLIAGLSKIKASPGRMNKLRGVQNSLIIDDTYNSSPLAAESALKTLYSLDASQRIAVLGDMNELGESSENEHKRLGEFCDGTKLDMVVTVGDQAEKFIAPAAKAKGCHVASFKDALHAGMYVKSILKPKAALLFKGSQGGIYLEEAVKIILHSTDDEKNLVRQSDDWLAIKKRHFDSSK